jgi:peptidoglycan/xylan/chitin deacetylase (PgdA/CDA1 family)
VSARALEVRAATRWRPSPTLAASMGLHLAAAGGTMLQPQLWSWALGAIVANHAFLAALGMWPRSTLLGPNLTRLPRAAATRGEIGITFDDGPDPEVTPQVLDMLEAHGARATFFCIAEKASRHPALCREIVRRGHGVENHSRRHSHAFALNGLGGFRREISAAQAVIAEASGRPPRFFRTPAGLRNPLLDPVLHALGLRLVSWTRRGFDTRRDDAGHVAALLTQSLAAGDILLMHDGNSARTAEGRPVVLEVLPRVLDRARSLNLRPVALHQAIES